LKLTNISGGVEVRTPVMAVEVGLAEQTH